MEKPKIKYLTKDEQIVLCKLAQNGNKAARNKLLESNYRFIFDAVKSLVGPMYDIFDDCFQEGLLGLEHAIDKFDCTSGFNFLSYAVYWVRAYVTRYLRGFNNNAPFRLPENILVQKFSKKVSKSSRRVQCIGGEYADKLPDNLKNLEEVINYSFIDERNRPDSDVNIFDIIPSPAQNEENAGSILDLLDLSGLSRRERQVIKDQRISETLVDTSDLLGISRERARQLKFTAIQKIRKNNKKLIEDKSLLEVV